MRPFLLLVLASAAALHAAAAAAQPAAPRCTPQREGEVACLDGKLCECRFDPGGILAGRPAGTRWNCGALRPNCGAPAPADVAPPAERSQPPPLPPFLPMPYPAPAAGWR